MVMDWQELNTHTMKFCKERAIRFVCIQMQKEFRFRMSTMVLRPGTKGASVELTIDLRMQEIVERELLQAMEKYDATQALAIVMNPKTGELLSLASAPTFHPAEYQNVDPSIYNRNLPVWMTFEPGSTFKILTLAAGLEEKVIDLHK